MDTDVILDSLEFLPAAGRDIHRMIARAALGLEDSSIEMVGVLEACQAEHLWAAANLLIRSDDTEILGEAYVEAHRKGNTALIEIVINKSYERNILSLPHSRAIREAYKAGHFYLRCEAFERVELPLIDLAVSACYSGYGVYPRFLLNSFIRQRTNEKVEEIIASACAGGDVKMIEYVLSVFPEVDRYDVGVRHAAEEGRVAAVELLLSKGWTGRVDEAFTGACRRGHKDAALFLWNNGGRFGYELSPDLERCFEASCLGGCLELVKLTHSPDFPYFTQRVGFGYACIAENIDTLEFLLRQTSFPQYVLCAGIVRGIEHNNWNVVEFFIARGAEVPPAQKERVARSRLGRRLAQKERVARSRLGRRLARQSFDRA